MKKLFVVAAAVLLSSASLVAQAQTQAETQTKASANAQASASANAGGNSAQLESGTTFEAQLTKSLDAKKNKPGDRVEAKATKDVKSNGEVVVPKNSKLIGRVTEAKARGEGQSESALGIVFEKAVTKDGREIPLNVVIQAVAASRSALAAQSGPADLMGTADATGSAAGSARGSAPRGNVIGGVASTVGSTAGAATGAAGGIGQTAGGAVGATTQTAGSVTGGVGGAVAGLDAAGNLTSASSGAIGLQGLALQSEAAGGAQGSLITCASRNVRLASGTRMMLRAAGQASAQQ